MMFKHGRCLLRFSPGAGRARAAMAASRVGLASSVLVGCSAVAKQSDSGHFVRPNSGCEEDSLPYLVPTDEPLNGLHEDAPWEYSELRVSDCQWLIDIGYLDGVKELPFVCVELDDDEGWVDRDGDGMDDFHIKLPVPCVSGYYTFFPNQMEARFEGPGVTFSNNSGGMWVDAGKDVARVSVCTEHFRYDEYVGLWAINGTFELDCQREVGGPH